MKRISKLQQMKGDGQGGHVYDCDAYWFFCPGCEQAHQYRVGGGTGPRWSFNGDMEKPTFRPSLLMRGSSAYRVCHLFLTDGKLEFCADSTHALAGQTVELPELPDWLKS